MKMKHVALLALLGTFLFAAFSCIDARFKGVGPESAAQYAGELFQCDGGKTIVEGRINDDYCDCEDGTDEPGTSACVNGRFYCRNKGFVGEYIYSSRVNDGICDCCDGTDEYASNSVAAKCKNDCHTKGTQLRKDKLEEIHNYAKGLSVRAQYVAEAKQKKDEKQAAVAELKVQLEARRLIVSQKEAAVVELEPHEDKAKETIEKYEEEEEEEVATEVKEGEEGAPAAAEAAVEKVPLTAEQQAELAAAQKLVDDIKQRRDELNDANNAVSTSDNEVRDLESYINTDFGPDDAYLPIHDQPFQYRTTEYTYELRPFKSTKQDHTSLGEWGKWLDSSKMRYDEGGTCWGVSYRRNCEVTLICGSENAVLKVEEPNKCEYAMLFKTPAACDPAHYAQLRADYKELTGEEAPAAPEGWFASTVGDIF